MEKLRIRNEKKEYRYENIRPESENVLKIVFADEIPPEFGDLTLITAGGIKATTLHGYDTVYQRDGNTIWLSNNGTVYQEPEPTPEPAPPTDEELLVVAKASKKEEVSRDCEKIIYNGVTVTLQNGDMEHFSLTEHDQINLFGKQAQLAAGAEQLEYHADGQPCRYYSAADMQAIIEVAMFHVSYHTTYCNAINMWIAGCETAEAVQAIFYGADVPEEYQSEVLKAYLLQIAAMAGENEDESQIAG